MEDFNKKFNDEDDGDAIREFKWMEIDFGDKDADEILKNKKAEANGEIYFPQHHGMGFGF